jgi:hypothetical protein
MAFDLKKFSNAVFSPREELVDVPDLHEFFPEGEKPQIKVRGLDGQELARVHDALSKNKNIGKLIDGLLSSQSTEMLAAVQEAIGVTDKTPNEIAKRLEMLVIASVEPKFTMDMAVKFCRVWPIEFYSVTTTISKLTGQGMMPGKSKPSGTTPESKPVSP